MRNFSALVFSAGLASLLLVLFAQFDFGQAPSLAGKGILSLEPDGTGAANLVTSVVLAYRGLDTLGEIAILFASAAAAGLVLGRRQLRAPSGQSGFILSSGASVLFPLLLLVGFYIILHGHLSPGGGFQGGVILAAAFFLPRMAQPSLESNHFGLSVVEGLAGATFIVTGLIALFQGQDFMAPLFSPGVTGALLSSGSLPLLYLALGLKVGSELAGLLLSLSEFDVNQSEGGA